MVQGLWRISLIKYSRVNVCDKSHNIPFPNYLVMWLHMDSKQSVCILGSEVVRAASSGVQLQLGSVHRRGKKGDGKLSGKRKSEQEALRR